MLNIILFIILAYYDQKSKEVSSLLLSLLVLVTIYYSLNLRGLDGVIDGFLMVGAFVIFELLTTTLIQDVVGKIYKDKGYETAVLIGNGDFPAIFVYGAMFGIKEGLFAIWCVFILIAVGGYIMNLYFYKEDNKSQPLTVAAYPYFALVFILFIINKEYQIFNVDKLLYVTVGI